MQTPDGSLLDIIRNATDILSDCNINIPKVYDILANIFF